MASRIYPMGLIFSAILLLVIPGLIFNVSVASGLNPQFNLTCSNNPGDYTCQNQYPSGCALDPASCTLNGTKISFLNQASPFTPLLSGNVFGGFSYLNSNGNSAHGPFDSSGGGTYYPANCVMDGVGASTNMTVNSFAAFLNSCTQANPDNSNVTKALAFKFTNWNGAQGKIIPATEDSLNAGASTTGTTLCITTGACPSGGAGESFTNAGDLQVVGVTTLTAGGTAATATVADSNGNTYTLIESVTQTCGGGGADKCWVGVFTAPNAVTGFIFQTVTLSMSTASSGWYVSCEHCSGVTVKHAGSASGDAATVASISPVSGSLILGTAVIQGASTAACNSWTAGVPFALICPGTYGSFLSAGQAAFVQDYSGGPTTVPISNSAGTGWAEDVIALGPVVLNSTVGTQTIPFYSIGNNATYALTCYNQGWYYVTSQPSVGYSTLGCDYYVANGYSPPTQPNVNPVFSFLVAIPASQATGGLMTGYMPTGYYHIQVFVQPQNWDTQFCTNSFFGLDLFYQSQSCINMETWFTTPHGSGSLQAGFLTPFLTIIVGLILFLVGLGINLQAGGSIFGSGTTLGAGVNQQGTRLAQVLGIALIIYTPLYSEFSTWFTSGLLPLGLDGNITAIASGGGIIALVISALLFGGVFWLILSWGSE